MVRQGSYEIGLFSKFYLHGRLSGRRSHLYYGPQLRFGVRKMTYVNTFSSNAIPYDFQVNITKALVCPGGHYQLGHGVFEWSIPFPAGPVCSTCGIFRSRTRWPTTRGFAGGR